MAQMRKDLNSLGLIDFAQLEPQAPYNPPWTEVPLLPPIKKFQNVGDAIQYIYDTQPKLQGYMNAMHGRMLETGKDFEASMDKEGLEDLLAKLRQAIVGMDKELGDLRKGIAKGLTKRDVLQMIGEALAPDPNSETAIGQVKCMACGRDMRQVIGASYEAETIRRLGLPPNALALLASQGNPAPSGEVRPLWGRGEELDTGMIESPRSVKPATHHSKSRKQK
jgi:hypothetical protein